MTKIAPVTISQLIKALPSGSSESEAELITAAYEYLVEAHGDASRDSRETYVDHDLSVAFIVGQLGLDIETTIAALLHDVLLPHTGKSESDVVANFGAEIASLVTALDRLAPYTETHDVTRSDKSLEAIRRAILSIIEGDTRAILIHLADRLQDLRKASELSPEKRKQLALEARDIHAPLANRLGIWQVKWELEDLAFRYLEPQQFRLIAGLIAERRDKRSERIEAAAQILGDKIREANIEVTVVGRPKHIYSIYSKMRDKGLNFDQIYDARALRVIIEDEQPYLCYQVLGIVHNQWIPIPNEFDDYIARSKPNGYQSLHTAVIDKSGQALEVQIRTRSMHEEAERGIAAHWAYKEGGRTSKAINQHVNWLRQIIDGLTDSNGSTSESEVFGSELLGERIYVFTPQGDVIDLPAGSTPIDFAYAIHTEVGHRCRGSRINGKMVSLDRVLESGDRIEIITANKGGPSRDWMNESLGYTGSARSRSKIRNWFRKQEREENISSGRDIVNRELKRLGVSDVFSLEEIGEALKYDDADQFLANVGFGDIQSTQIGGAISSLQQKLQPDDDLRQLIIRQKPQSTKLTVRGIAGLHTIMAGCCSPIPPEPIMGYITRGRGVTIHTMDCKQLLATGEPERWIEVEWGLDDETYPIPIVIKAYRRPGLMDEIANILNGARVNLAKTKTITADSITSIYMVAEVISLDQLNWILGKFERMNNVIEARRQQWTD
ncbi:MAG TPA: bifunctional (p)ppGpp synthetase/guanosine-3',5'-bis(diphosphate) 3'-pyrophosphohydrolase [candidate division Zixibacteria bacterium]|nr:bifunctional (p)ppGpp synthetase/guanosine-3',5'-bis(diphosphate) 3'-pyrophosphohydrolase [candidate division Zixibacteria bacterium]